MLLSKTVDIQVHVPIRTCQPNLLLPAMRDDLGQVKCIHYLPSYLDYIHAGYYIIAHT